MKYAITFLAFIFILGQSTIFGQTWALHINGNETYALGNELKGIHPMLWYSKAQDKIVFGGFGLGLSNTRTIKEGTWLRVQANLQRSRFYDIPSIIRDENGVPILASIGINSNYNLNLLAMALWEIGKKRRTEVGVGLGGRAVAYAKTDFGEAYVNGEKRSLNLRTKSLSPAVLVLPATIGYHAGQFLVSTRTELALTRVNRITQWRHERSVIVYAEIAYRFKTL